MISRTGVLPTDPRFQELSRNELLLRYTVHWLRKRETDTMDWWMRVLGMVWTREDVEQMGKPSADQAARVFMPLALACNPDLAESLKQMFSRSIAMGDYQPAPGEQVVELGDMSPEEFKRWAAQATGALGPKSDESVTLGSETADPKIERMREQIAHSKRKR